MTQVDYTCLRCGEKLIARRCKIQCPRCGYTEDCADAGLIDYDRQKRYQCRPGSSSETNRTQLSDTTSHRYTSNND